MIKYKIGILGCGAIFNRHLSAIQQNSEHYKLLGIYDPQTDLQQKWIKELKVKGYTSESELYNDKDINCVVILSPNYLHFTQAQQALNHGKHVILEKPATFLSTEIQQLNDLANSHQLNIFGILQVRLNASIMIMHKAITQGILGDIRSVSLVQRWQRPESYFHDWRGSMNTGGGILREFGIHYLDVMQYLFGMPQIVATKCFNTKFRATDVADTIYSLLDFGKFGGTLEISIAAEPKNIECTLSIMSTNGFIKLGGASLNEIITSDFIDEQYAKQLEQITHQIQDINVAILARSGVSPYHPELYRQIIHEPQKFQLQQMYNVISLIEQIYAH